jgi:hypothetical protein
MTRRGFLHHKEEFGTPSSKRQDRKAIEIPGLSDVFESEMAGITRGKMIFYNSDIRTLFDSQVSKIFQLVDRQIEAMSQRAPQSQITHMILSGGLGSSEYVKAQLKDRYIIARASPRYCAPEMRILTSLHP